MFSDKLANHESVVNSKLWTGIQSQIGVGASSTAVAAKGISMATKWIIGVTSVVAVSTVALVLNYTDTNTKQVTPKEISKDSTEMIADNKEVENEGSEDVVSKETATTLIVDNSSTKTAEILSSTPEADKMETTSTLSNTNTPDKLIVKQAAPSKASTTDPVQKTDKITKESKPAKQIITEPIASRSGSTGTVQEWKKTNVFSPNNDGINDLFFLETKALKEFSITIINEKNDVVFISDDQNFKWDGTNYKTGEMVPQGSYGYIVFAIDVYNNPIKLFNTLNISR